MQMPDLDGLALGRAICAQAMLDTTRLIMLTAFDEKGQNQEARAAGYAAYLTKPVRQARLLETIVDVLSERQGGQPPPPAPASKESFAPSLPSDPFLNRRPHDSAGRG